MSTIKPLVPVLVLALCAACSQAPVAPSGIPAKLSGQTLAGAKIEIYDTQGALRAAQADAKGLYTADTTGLQAPLMVVAETQGKQLVAITPQAGGTANVSTLTDRIASDVAVEFKFSGPSGMAESKHAPNVSVNALTAKTNNLRKSLAPALHETGLGDGFDPLTAAPSASLSELLGMLIHNRGYDSPTGKRGETSLYDPYYREVTTFVPFSLKLAEADQKDINAPGVIRVFIAGDSTASIYDKEREPRNGWGQIFQRQFKDGSPVRVVDVAQSGRSSRSFIDEGWFDMIAANIREGDYLLVQFGHNDEKCGNNPPAPLPKRDTIDIKGLCTYPGNAAGIPADMSFQKTLEKYIALAKSKKAIPVLITPVTRRAFKDGVISGTTHTYSKGAFPGDYSQTVRDTAKANGVALVDLDAKSMAFFNKIGEAGSLDYYLAVDTTKYPFYVGQTGARNKPDNTHFQERGAEAVGHLVAEGLQEDKLGIASYIK